MPALIALGRRWHIGSDDLAFPAIVEVLIRCFWLIALLIVWPAQAINKCQRGSWLYIYCIGTVSLLVLIALWSILIARASLRGSVMQEEPRKLVPFLLHTRVALAVLDFGWNILGTVVLLTTDLGCTETKDSVRSVVALIVIHWVCQILVLLFVAAAFDPLSGRRKSHSLAEATSIWKRRFQCVCCSCFPGCCVNRMGEDDPKVLTDVALLLASTFHGVDLVPTDIAAGLILLNMRYKNGKRAQKSLGTSHLPRSEMIAERLVTEPLPWLHPNSAMPFLKFALASYGWKLYALNRCGRCRSNCLPPGISCCSCLIGPRQENVVGDNCCLGDLAALKATTGLKDDAIIYASFANEPLRVPFFVAADHETSSVVVAVRGTLSWSDILTDIDAGADAVAAPGLPTDWMAHKGMLRAARTVVDALQQQSCLNTAFVTYPTYGLVVTGHSLGAGVAVLVSLLLKHQYPHLKSYAFSPPGGLLCRPSADFCRTFCMSLVVGHDWIPRLSFQSIRRLQRDIISELERCPHPKFRLLIHGCWRPIFSLFSSLPIDFSMMDPVSECNVQDPVELAVEHVPLYLPGHILQINRRKHRNVLDGKQETVYDSHWAECEDYGRIVVTLRMLTDHLLHSVDQALRYLIINHKAEPRLHQPHT